jgi:hypothetical protein
VTLRWASWHTQGASVAYLRTPDAYWEKLRKRLAQLGASVDRLDRDADEVCSKGNVSSGLKSM